MRSRFKITRISLLISLKKRYLLTCTILTLLIFDRCSSLNSVVLTKTVLAASVEYLQPQVHPASSKTQNKSNIVTTSALKASKEFVEGVEPIDHRVSPRFRKSRCLSKDRSYSFSRTSLILSSSYYEIILLVLQHKITIVQYGRTQERFRSVRSPSVSMRLLRNRVVPTEAILAASVKHL